jgi:hypothetical protein
VLGGSLATGLAALLTVSARSQAGPPAADLRLLTVRDSGFDGTVPGPALQVRRGEEVRLRVVNQMAEPTAVHWHGVRLANAMDGTPRSHKRRSRRDKVLTAVSSRLTRELIGITRSGRRRAAFTARLSSAKPKISMSIAT